MPGVAFKLEIEQSVEFRWSRSNKNVEKFLFNGALDFNSGLLQNLIGIKKILNAHTDEIGQSLEVSLREHFKLSSYEAKTYLTILRLGAQNPKQISANAGVPMPRIYDTLDSLMSKGFALKSEKGYAAISPKRALKGRTSQFELQFAQEQKRRKQAEEELTLLLEQSSTVSNGQKDSGEIAILRGVNTIANKFGELLENSDDIILVAKRAVEAREIFIPILLDFASSKKKRKIRIIVPSGTKITKQELSEASTSSAEIRKSDNIIFDMMITERDDVIIGVPDPLSEEINHAIAIWVKNTSFSRSTRESVEELWKQAQKA